MNFLFYFRF